MTTTTTASTADAIVLELTRLFEAPPARVFDAWLDPEQWQQWMGPPGVTCEVPQLDARVGGRYRAVMRPGDGRVIAVGGVFKTIDAPRRLAFTWCWEGEAQETLVTLTFRDLDGRTELTLRHENFSTAANRDNHGRGWNGSFDKLAALLGHAASAKEA